MLITLTFLISIYNLTLCSLALNNIPASHALFTLKTVTEYYVKGGSTVNLCALDIAKAFDRVDHYALLKVLMDRYLSKNFIELLHDWLLKCYVCVRWGLSLIHI